jgi:DNA-directed RNA polymerase subunit RPC12/RpoP
MLNKGYGAKVRDENFEVDAGPPLRCPHCKKIICESDAKKIKIRCKHCRKWVFIFKKDG